jgi:hypothetical protein
MSTKNRFLVEIMGVTACQATKVDGLEAMKHTPAKLMVGNRPNPILARGNYEVGEVTVNHAESLGLAGAELYEKLRAYAKGEAVQPFDARVMLMSEDGATPIKSYECLGCVPTSFKNDGMDAGSNDHAMFTFAFLPDDVIVL